MNDYSDIININYNGPKNHPRMTIQNRAAQFASFKALSGYDDNLKEARRIVDSKIVLSEDKQELLDRNLKDILKNMSKKVKITYFIKDLKKKGGYYKTIEANLKKVDFISKEIVSMNNNIIKIDDILDINLIE